MASATSGSFTTNLAAGSSSANKYTMTLAYSYSHNASNNSTNLTITGTIKSNNSSYASYKNSSSNTVQVRDTNSSGTSRLSQSPTTAYDCRNLGSTQIFSYSVTIPHDSSGNRTVYVSWTFDGLQSSWNPTGTVTGTITFPQSSFTVSYDANGGTGAPSSQTKYYGTALTLSSTIPTKSGYKFLGWGTSSTTTSVSYSAGDSYTSNSSVTLYAIWETEEKYTLSYDANGGVAAPKSVTYIKNADVYISSSKPIKSGYNFLGWGTSSSTSTTSYNPGDQFDTSVASNSVLYAIWSKRSSQNIYLYSTGKSYAFEYVEGNGFYMDADGRICSTNIVETGTSNDTFKVSSIFSCGELIEGTP